MSLPTSTNQAIVYTVKETPNSTVAACLLAFKVNLTANDQALEIENTENSNKVLSKTKYDVLAEKITSFVDLDKNWDGYGAVKVLPEVTKTASSLISMLNSSLTDRVTDLFPNPNGTITIEWENRRKEKLSLEIGQENYSYFVKFQDKKPLLVDGTAILSEFKDFSNHLEDLFSEEIQKYILS